MNRSFRYLAAASMLAGCYVPALRAAEESELKDADGKTIDAKLTLRPLQGEKP